MLIGGLFGLLVVLPRTARADSGEGDMTNGHEDLPRGIRNNNPTNIIYNAGVQWQGQIGSDGRYAIFDSPLNGLRAAAINLHTYMSKHRLQTIRQIINRWAPSSENDTNAYIRSVSQRTGLSSDQPLNWRTHVKPLLKAIVFHENGMDPYEDKLYDKAIAATGR